MTQEFNALTRPWFQDAVTAGQAVWSKIYADISTQELQITAVQPLFTATHQLNGVLGSSFFFTQINEFLRSLHIGKTGQTFIVERDGNLVTASTNTPLIYSGHDKKDNRIKAVDSENALISRTARYLTEVKELSQIQQAQQLDFSIHNKRQFVQVTPLQDKWGLDWLIVVVVPEADFMQQIEKNTRVTIVLSIAGLLLAILLGIITANTITRPLRVLVTAAHTMASGKLDQHVKLSKLSEIAALGRSFNQMAQQLRGSFTALEKINEVLEQRVIERTAELQKTAAELRALFSAMTELIFVYDTQGRYLKIAPTNPAAIYKPSNHLLGKTLHEVLPLAQADTFLQYIHQVTETQQTFNVEYNLKIAEREFWFSASISPITHDSVVWVARDITEKKKAESELLLEQEKSERLLLNILPKAIAEQLKQSHSAIAEHFDEVTIMFADIVDFTPLSARLSPQELVESLNRIFSTFDQLVERYDLEKIKTIGDAYMVAGGLPIPNNTHAENIVEMALEMQDKILDLQTVTGEQFQIRIGINTGPVVAGVIGIKKFIYDLWGDTVNVASRMESRGAPGCIQVTERTYQLLKNKYVFEQRGIIHVKGKGEMMTYWLKGRNPSHLLQLVENSKVI
jgi:PAS domain S-box-containing protein